MTCTSQEEFGYVTFHEEYPTLNRYWKGSEVHKTVVFSKQE